MACPEREVDVSERLEISNEDLSNLYSRRIFIDEIFPQVDLVQGQTTALALIAYPKTNNKHYSYCYFHCPNKIH